MKRTDMARKERELKRSIKKTDKISKCSDQGEFSVSNYIDQLSSLFYYDENKIYNIDSETKILEMIDCFKKDLPEKQWENVLRKAIKKTQIKERDDAYNQLKVLMDI